MKTLFLLRHAKSSWDNDNLSDFDRPLNKSGLEIIPRIGETIFDNRFKIDAILSSPAKRAKQTAILVREAAQLTAHIEYDDRIYEASPHRLLNVVGENADTNNSIMLVGHNPGLEGFIKVLTGEIQSMQTGTLAVIDLKIERWSKLAIGSGFVRKMINPKNEMEAESRF